MQLIDEILEYLQYYSMSSRLEIEGYLSGNVSSATVKRIMLPTLFGLHTRPDISLG